MVDSFHLGQFSDQLGELSRLGGSGDSRLGATS
jgi:hypothetical protein